MIVFQQQSWNVVVHGKAAGAFGIVPSEIDASKFSPGPVGGDGGVFDGLHHDVGVGARGVDGGCVGDGSFGGEVDDGQGQGRTEVAVAAVAPRLAGGYAQIEDAARRDRRFLFTDTGFGKREQAHIGEQVGAASQRRAVDAQADASVITAFCMGRLQRFARSGFKRPPSENLDHGLRLLLPDGRLWPPGSGCAGKPADAGAGRRALGRSP